MYVTFRAGALDLAVPAAAVAEIVTATALRRLPGMAPAMAGIMIGTDGIIGVVDLARLAGAAPAGVRAVVVLAGEPRLGLLVEAPDALPRGFEAADSEIADAPLPLLGVLRVADMRFHRVDLDGLRSRLRAQPSARRQGGGEDGDPDSGDR